MSLMRSAPVDPTRPADDPDLRHATPLPHAPGELRVSWRRAIWLWAMVLGWVGLAWAFTTPGALIVYALSTSLTLCLGHSVGLHRGAIHRSYRTRLGVERALVLLATLTGMGGPLSLVRMHQRRDYWQSQPAAPAYYSYAHGPLLDLWWYLHVDHHPRCPEHDAPVWLDPLLMDDPFYQRLERAWMWTQAPVALALWAVGGLPWVCWGVCARVATGIIGHWLVNYVAHTHGAQRWHVEGAGEQGRNSSLFGALSMGEGWHNNHHAWPRSAKLGLEPGQLDPGFWAIALMAKLGLVWDVRVAPHMENSRDARPGVDAWG